MATVISGKTQQFTAQQSGNTVSVTWSASQGTINSSGLFTAPSVTTATNVVITATATSNSQTQGTASVTVEPPGTPPPISVTIAPTSVTLNSGATQQFTATVQNASNTAINWSVTQGIISSSGLFQAPVVSSDTTATVTASSVADPTQKASAAITVRGSGFAVSTNSLSNATALQPYNATLAASGGKAPYSWSISSGSLPSGMSLSATGVISGTTTAIGQFSFTVGVSDSSSPTLTASQLLVLDVNGITVTFYVATDGNDSFSGTLPAPNAGNTDGPFATFDRARTAVQTVNRTGVGQIVVQFRAGTYFLPATLNFTSADSGSALTEIIYQNYPNETPIISGGVVIPMTAAAGKWGAQLDPTKYQYFENLFVNGTRRFRPTSTNGTYLRNAGPVYVSSSSANCSIQVGTQWECFDRFYYNAADLNSNWTNLKAPYPAGDIEIDSFEWWTVAELRLQSLDTVNHIAYLTGPTYINPNNGFFPNHRYLVLNVKDALSQPGQWFLDRSTTPWTLTYLPESGEDPTTAQVIAPQLSTLLTANSLSYVTFSGLTFSHDNWTVPAAGHQPLQAEPSIPAALSFTNSSHITFDGVTISHTTQWALEFVGDGTGASTSDVVQNSMFYDLGTGGIRIGKIVNGSDTDANVPQFNTVQNNVVAGFERIIPAGGGSAIWIGDSHDNTITQNEVFDGYNGGIGVCMPQQGVDCHGTSNSNGPFNNTISFNLIYQLGQGVTDDFGCIYLATMAATGNQVLNNRCHDMSRPTEDSDGYGGNGIYLDSTTHGVTVKNNLIYRATDANFHTTYGPQSMSDAPNLVENNIFAYTSGVTRGPEPPVAALSLRFSNNLVYFDQGIVQSPGHWYCWNMSCASIFDFSSNAYWDLSMSLGTVPNAFMTTDINGNNLQTISFAQWQAKGEDPGTVIADPGFTNPTYPTDDYSLVNTNVSAQVGFVPFDTTLPGRTSKLLNPPPVPAAFPLVVPNPATGY